MMASAWNGWTRMIGAARKTRLEAGTARRGPALLALALALTACGGGPAAVFVPDPESPCASGNALCEERVQAAGGVYIPVYRTYSLEKGSGEPTLAVIVVHGTNRDADAYFTSMVLAAGDAKALARTLIVSPHFQVESDGPAPDEARWTSSGWKRGNLSLSSGPEPRVSSYAALDRILEIVTDRTRFPGIERVVVTGHSAGGQVVHRYAATSPLDSASLSVPIRYIPANPSTWLYLGPERWNGSGFSIPDASQCGDYNDWHYGLDERNTYARAASLEQIRTRLTTRDVILLAGDADRGSSNLDQSCGANLQGAYRYERAQRMAAYMDARFDGHNNRLVVVPGVGHSSQSMFRSDAGLAAIFLP